MIRKKEPFDVEEFETVFNTWEKAKQFNETFLAHLFLFYVEFASARENICDYIIRFITSYVKEFKEQSNKTSFFFSAAFKLTADGNLRKKSKKYLQNYLNVLVAHATPTACDECVLPRKVQFLFKKPLQPVCTREFEHSNGSNHRKVMYSEETNYGVFPLLRLERQHQINQSVFILPRIDQGHVTLDSQYAHFNSKDFNLKNARKFEEKTNKESNSFLKTFEKSKKLKKSKKSKKSKRRSNRDNIDLNSDLNFDFDFDFDSEILTIRDLIAKLY